VFESDSGAETGQHHGDVPGCDLTLKARSRRLKPGDRAFWVALSRVWQEWRSPLVVVKPATVIDWHRRGCRRYWRWKSRRPGRPRIPAEHIAMIRRVSTAHREWGEDRIAEELALKLGVTHSTSTIRRYMVRRGKPTGGQTWKTFISNHASQVFAVDFLTQYTALFTVVCIFVVMETCAGSLRHPSTPSDPPVSGWSRGGAELSPPRWWQLWVAFTWSPCTRVCS
jgi:putative transposase